MNEGAPVKDVQTVDRDGQSIAPRIAGVTVYQPRSIPTSEASFRRYRTEARDPLGLPVVHVYMVMVRPGKVADGRCTPPDRPHFHSTGEPARRPL